MKRLLYALLLVLIVALPAAAATQFDFLLSQVRTSTTSLAGGKVYFYAPGTTTPATVWLDRAQTLPASNPYTLDANGTAQLYGNGAYRVVMYDSSGTKRFDRDNLMVIDFLKSGGEVNVTALGGLSAAIDSYTLSGTTITLDVTDAQTITANKTVPANVFLRVVGSGVITVASGKTLTVNGDFSGCNGCFAGPGAVRLVSAWGNPRWWGAKGDGVTDDAVALQSALNAGKTRWTTGQYLTGTALTAKYDIVFDDWAATSIVAKPNTTLTPVLSISGDITNSVFTRTFRNINVVAATRSTAHQSGVIFQRGPNPLGSVAILDIQNIYVANMNGYGVKFDSVWDSHISNIHTEGCGSEDYAEDAGWFGSTTGDSFNQNTVSGLQFERSVYRAMNVDVTAYSNRFLGMHIEATTNIGTDIILGGYRNQYYGAGHLGANHRHIYIGGENNVYDGLFLESTEVRDGNWNPGAVYRLSNCVIVNTYNGNGGAGYPVFNNCTLGTFQSNGQEAKLVNCDTTTLIYGFMSLGLHVVGGTIGTISGDGTLGYLELLENVKVATASNLTAKSIITNATFASNLTLTYAQGSSIDNSTILGNLTLYGNTSTYAYKVSSTRVQGNLWVDANEGSTIANCAVFGNATESGSGTASYLSNTVVKGTTTGFAVQALAPGSTVPTATVGDNSQKVANTAFVKAAVDSVCTSGYTWVDPHTWNYVKCAGTSTAYGYVPNGANPMHTIIGAGVFTGIPTCVLTPATSDTTVRGTMTGATYDSGTGQVTLTAYSTNSGIGMFAICVGK